MKELLTQDVKPQPLRALLHSRTVLEGERCVASGVLSYVEGDLMDVELPEFDRFQLGEQVKVTLYSPVGMHTFTTRVIARDKGSLLLIHPPHQQRKFIDKRDHPRVEIRKHGFILARESTSGSSTAVSSPIAIQINDISLGGLGFTTLKDVQLGGNEWVVAELQLGFSLPCRLQIKRQMMKEKETFYGAVLENAKEEGARALRAYILREQIEYHVNRKSKRGLTGAPVDTTGNGNA
ncbi:PilZ domain-containing protein [Paenibacillus sp. 481]|uniref:PilZ domain-containing protein n=1 Tax=Paenibacillus sp. 481 TaxID=2835869 RepID=UPI001E3F8239|nr:PilZ domain-containing protein [Paenibacillus sp. 481]UHA74754.1 PilZ domain-containing protein [Paenibacillus sp. 481]